MAKKKTPKMVKLRIQDSPFVFLLPVKRGVAVIKLGDSIKTTKGKVFMVESFSGCGANSGFSIDFRLIYPIPVCRPQTQDRDDLATEATEDTEI